MIQEPPQSKRTIKQSVPERASDYQECLSRNARCYPRLTDVDWLVRRGMVKAIEDAAQQYASGSLLDIGCGGKPYESCFSLLVETYTGLDTPASVHSRSDVVGFADDLPFPNGSFDTVLCSEVIEHLAEPQKAVNEMFRVLRPGGHLILTAPQTWHLHEEPWDFYRYTVHGLRNLLTKAGFEVLREISYGGPWAMLGTWTIIHFGSYPQWLVRNMAAKHAERNAERPSNAWQKWLLPFRLPIAVVNVLCAALDRFPHPGIYWLGNAIVGEKRGD